jgi:hypothetical protein
MKKFLKSYGLLLLLIIASMFVVHEAYTQVAGNSVLFRRVEGIWSLTDQINGSPQSLEIYNTENPPRTYTKKEKATMGWVGKIYTTTYGTSGTGNAGRVIQAATYSIAGTQAVGAHMVQGSVLTSSGAGTVTFSNTAVYTGSTTYICNANDMTHFNTAVMVVPTSGTSVSFALSTAAADSIGYQCNGT